MEHLKITEVEPDLSAATLRRTLTGALGAEHMAINYYKLAPGDAFAYGYHSHDSQEKIFLVLAETVTFRTEAGPVDVREGEVVRFAPGEYQQGRNKGEERVSAVALGAPQDTGGSEILRECDTCERETPQSLAWTDDGSARVTRCVECGETTGRWE
jgi:uncharacterized cupin superfamily protein